MMWVILLHFAYTSYGDVCLIFLSILGMLLDILVNSVFFEKFLGFTIDFFLFFPIIYIDNVSK